MIGRFVWHDLTVNDPKAAMAFYTEVIGWKTEPFGEQTGPEAYNMWVGAEGPLGGVMELPAAAKAMKVPGNWMGHVEVNDVDETVARVKALGGVVHHGPEDVPTVGRFAVIADPQGAAISVFKPAQVMDVHDVSKHGEISWNELYTTDAKAALAFYGEIFGWTTLSQMDMGGPMGTYYIYGLGDVQLGGVMNRPPDMQMPPSWVYYVHVDDLDAAIDRAKRLGAQVLFGPMDVPDGGRVAQLLDSQGVWFALHAQGRPSS
jgi:hypothetical protein